MKNKSQSDGCTFWRKQKTTTTTTKFVLQLCIFSMRTKKNEKRSKSIREDVKNLCFTMMKTDPMTPIDRLRNDDSIVCHFSSYFVWRPFVVVFDSLSFIFACEPSPISNARSFFFPFTSLFFFFNEHPMILQVVMMILFQLLLFLLLLYKF